MIQRIQHYLARQGLLEAGDRVAVAVSGGADSVALVEALNELRPRLGITLAVAHFNHCLRGQESDADARFVQELARERGLPFFIEATDVARVARRERANREGLARRLRYRFFESLVRAGGATKVATGHTADDQAETVLARLLRGSGTRGLAGIYPSVQGWLIRPLLCLRRGDVRRWLAARGGRWREDSSNRDLRLTRNRLRTEVLPVLATFNPRIVEQLGATAEIARDEEEHWDRRTYDLLAHVLVGKRTPAGTSAPLQLSISHLIQLDKAEQRRVLRAAAACLPEETVPRLEFDHVEALRRLALGSGSGKRLRLHGLEATRSFNELHLRSPVRTPPDPYEYQVTPPAECAIAAIGTRLVFNFVGREGGEPGYNEGEATLIDPETIRNPLTVRNWRPGDRFDPPERTGRRKIKTLLLERRVPAEQRRSWPLVLSRGEVVWMRGFDVAGPFRMRRPGPAIRIREEAQEEATTDGEDGNSAE